jgi:pseudomonalisin/xanthomonalisin
MGFNSWKNFSLPRTLALACLPLAAVTGTAQADEDVATATAAYEVQGLAAAGRLVDTEAMHILVGLRMRDRAGLDAFVSRVHDRNDALFGRFMTPEQFLARHAPSETQVRLVTDYLSRHGFTNITVEPNRMFVSADGNARAVRTAFRTELLAYNVFGRHAFANSREARVPRHLGDIVLSVQGLQTVDMVRPMHAFADTHALPQVVHGVNPTAFPSIYDVGSTPTGSQTTVGIIAAGDISQTITDLRTFESQNSLVQVPVQNIQVGSAGSDTSGVIEWDLDSQSIQGMAGTVNNLIFYTATSLSTNALSLAYNRVVTDHAAKAINVSLGICERSSKTTGEMASDDQVFAQAVAQGQTFVVSSGDGGAKTGCISQTGLLVQVSYPASSPYVVSVGGTTLNLTAGGAYSSETAWSGSGGGYSKYEAKPSWQNGIVSGSFRGVPDVAYDADPNSGAIIVNNGSSVQVGGTSLAAPLFTGTLARAQSANSNSLGFATPTIYSIAGQTPKPFHDVTSGSNGRFGKYNAAAGWDPVTGWGSPDITNFVNAN